MEKLEKHSQQKEGDNLKVRDHPVGFISILMTHAQLCLLYAIVN